MSYEEMHRIVGIFHGLGVDKIRITGGEPFVRKDLILFLKKIKRDFNPRSFSITSNATLLHHFQNDIPKLFDSINISLDSLDPIRFLEITRRDDFRIVKENIDALLDSDLDVKINAVVMDDRNIEDIIPFVEWTRNQKMEMRFIEEMPFNGSEQKPEKRNWDHIRILNHIKNKFENIEALPYQSTSTSMMYSIPGFKGKFGIIPAFSRTFCGTCNRIRLTAKGELRTCLYSSKGTDLLNPMRKGASDSDLIGIISNAINKKEKDGFEADSKRSFISIYESMTSIGG